MRLDLTTIRRIMAIVTIFVPVQGLDAYYHQIRAMISEELDFLREARNITRIADNFIHEPNVRFPRPIEKLCTRRVMTTTFTPGIKVGDVAALDAAGVDRKALAIPMPGEVPGGDDAEAVPVGASERHRVSSHAHLGLPVIGDESLGCRHLLER